MDNKRKIFSTIFIILGFIIGFEIITQVIGALVSQELMKSLLYGKYNVNLIAEFTVLVLSLIFVVIRKKWYIFKNPHNFKTSIKIGGPILVIAIIFFLIGGLNLTLEGINWPNLISLLLFTICIGLFEEIFYRGIIQNEITEKFSNNKKELLISLIISSLIFGLSHLSNAIFGQEIYNTIIQVFQTTAVGLILGMVYYLSKNIYSVAFLHGFYDFALMLEEVNLYKDCTYTSNVSLPIIIVTTITSLILILIYLVYSYILWQMVLISEDNINEEVNINSNKKKNICYVVISILTFSLFFISVFNSKLDYSDYYICYEYPEKDLSNIETHYYNYDDFNIKTTDLDIQLFIKKEKFIIKNNTNGIEKRINLKNIKSLVVFEYNGSYHVILENTNKEEIYYSNFLNNENLMEWDEFEKSFATFDVPLVSALGYLKDGDTDMIYPLIKTTTSKLFVVSDNQIYVVNLNT